MPIPLILASTSLYRRELIERLGLDFQVIAPLCDEDQFKKTISDPVQLAQTLANIKAKSLASADNCVIGGDQVAVFKDRILGKPKTRERAFEQLRALQGQSHQLITAVSVIHQLQEFSLLDITVLEMRPLSDQEIWSYIDKDQPLDCAASYKIEKSGITLMNQIQCEDFTAIQGLPLIRLSKILRDLGYKLLQS